MHENSCNRTRYKGIRWPNIPGKVSERITTKRIVACAEGQLDDEERFSKR